MDGRGEPSPVPYGPGGMGRDTRDVQEWDEAVGAWVMVLRASGRAETTIRTRTDHLRYLGRTVGVGPWEVDGGRLLGWTAEQSWARETRRSVRASLRGFYGWGHRAGLVEVDPSLALPTVRPGPAKPRPAPELVYREALAAADERGRLMLRLAAEAGLRRGEIAVIHRRDLVADLLGWSLVVHGKGGRERVVPLPTALALELRARGEGYAFPGDDGGHLSPRWVGKLATRVMPEGWTIHTLRHRFASRAYSSERDLLAVQTLLGHASPATTRRYVRVEDEWLRRAVLAAG